MKLLPLLAIVASTALLTPTATAGLRVSTWFGGGYGGYRCAPAPYYSRSVCYAPRVDYCAPRAVYYRFAPVYCVTPRVVYAPTAVTVAPIAFGWRR